GRRWAGRLHLEGLAAGDRARPALDRGDLSRGQAAHALDARGGSRRARSGSDGPAVRTVVSEAGAPDAFELRRPALVALARRMLGDPLQADDVVVEAWLRWQLGGNERGGLVALVADLCRRERETTHRSSMVDGDAACLVTAGALDRVSMALVAV